ncbi:MAG TPA: PsiF family protein [Rhodoplanes sp.]|nr:PsiF family protein [Rhodoplanes sp.]
MKTFIVAIALALTATGAYAQVVTCKAQASEKKLAGAALTSFMKKCERDARKACAADTKEKKLSGAAKNRHMKKCVGDAVGT